MESTGHFEFTKDKVVFKTKMDWDKRNNVLTEVSSKVQNFRLELILDNNLDKERMDYIIKNYLEDK